MSKRMAFMWRTKPVLVLEDLDVLLVLPVASWKLWQEFKLSAATEKIVQIFLLTHLTEGFGIKGDNVINTYSTCTSFAAG